MDSLTATYIILGAGGAATLASFAALILAPAWTSYGRTWERVAAFALTLFVLAAFIGSGVAVGLVIVYYWDSIIGLLDSLTRF